MAYGTTNGVSNNLKTYDNLIDKADITAAMVSDFRTKADAEIEKRIAPIVGLTNLPLASPPDIINSISDDLTTYFILRRLFVGKDPKNSDWVQDFWDKPIENLEWLLENPEIFENASGDELIGDGIEAGDTDDLDPIFGMERTKDGSAVTDQWEESQDTWKEM